MPGKPDWLQGLRVGLSGRHDLFVASLAALLSSRGADARVLEDPALALSVSGSDRIDVLLLESPLPSDLARLAAGPTRVLVLADRLEVQGILDAVNFGAVATLEKNASLAQLSVAIREALERRPKAVAGELTHRQREVLRLIAEGLDNSRIANRLGISQRTVRAHVSSLLERLGVENRTQAAVTAVRSGWIT
jgi:DNA-binding NarL/FixJ family response regulator